MEETAVSLAVGGRAVCGCGEGTASAYGPEWPLALELIGHLYIREPGSGSTCQFLQACDLQLPRNLQSTWAGKNEWTWVQILILLSVKSRIALNSLVL